MMDAKEAGAVPERGHRPLGVLLLLPRNPRGLPVGEPLGGQRQGQAVAALPAVGRPRSYEAPARAPWTGLDTTF